MRRMMENRLLCCICALGLAVALLLGGVEIAPVSAERAVEAAAIPAIDLPLANLPEQAKDDSDGEDRRIDPEKPMIALTFDDGPGPGTRRILRALESVDGRATFCMVGDRVNDYAQTARMVAEQGSEIATHTLSHPNLAKLSAAEVRAELEESIAAIEQVTGVRPGVLRPPYGSTSAEVQQVCWELGVVIANWNVDTEDWRVRDADAILNHVLDNARDGAIVLCHDLYPETAAAMEQAVEALAAQGYQLVSVSELLQARAGGGSAGKIYYAA